MDSMEVTLHRLCLKSCIDNPLCVHEHNDNIRVTQRQPIPLDSMEVTLRRLCLKSCIDNPWCVHEHNDNTRVTQRQPISQYVNILQTFTNSSLRPFVKSPPLPYEKWAIRFYCQVDENGCFWMQNVPFLLLLFIF